MNWGQRGIATIVTFVLAGLLGPADFGTVMMAVGYVGLLRLFLEQGIGTAIVQRRDLEPRHLDAAFWMNVAWSLLLMAVALVSSEWWARANGLPRLASVIDVLALSLPIRGLTVVQEAGLQRELRFKTLAARSTVSALAGGAAGIGLALAGAGVWALVGQSLVGALASLCLLWSVSGWKPGVRFSREHARSLLRFSVVVFSGDLAVYLNRRADAVLIGFFLGPTVVGFYRLAARLVEMLLELTVRPVQAIALSRFSRVQDEPDELRAAVRSSIHVSAVMAVPALLAVAAASDYIMAAVGRAWLPAAPALRILCAAGIARALTMAAGPMLNAVARPSVRAIALWSTSLVHVPVFAGTASALRSAAATTQVVGMAAASTAVVLSVLAPINLLNIRRITGLSLGTIARTALPAFFAGAAAVVVIGLIAATDVLAGVPPLAALAVVGTLGALAASAVLVGLEPGIRQTLRGGRPALAPARVSRQRRAGLPRG